MCSKKGSCVVKQLTNVIYYKRDSSGVVITPCLKNKNKLTPGDSIIVIGRLFSDANYVNPIGTIHTYLTILCVNSTNIGCRWSATRKIDFDDNGPNGAGTIIVLVEGVSPDMTVIDGVIQPFSILPSDLYVVGGYKNYVGGSGKIVFTKIGNSTMGVLNFDMTLIQCKEC
jgi:hypothetical protein